jgi:hypothetical protein
MLNSELPQFKLEINGHGIHFAHIRSADPSATPLLMVTHVTHGEHNQSVLARSCHAVRAGARMARLIHRVPENRKAAHRFQRQQPLVPSRLPLVAGALAIAVSPRHMSQRFRQLPVRT